MARNWSEQEKLEAITLAQAIGPAGASQQLGISKNTLKSWVQRMRARGAGAPSASPDAPKKTAELAAEATQRAVEQVAGQIAPMVSKTATRILDLVGVALEAIDATIDRGPNPDESNAGWLRSLVGVVAQGIEKHQLLTGQPTLREAHEGQVTQRYEYDIEARVEQYADVYRQLAERMVSRVVPEGDAPAHREPMDTR